MSHKATQVAVYDDRAKSTLQGLAEGKTRDDLALAFGLNGWKSLDVSMRRKGFVWEGNKQTYIPASEKDKTSTMSVLSTIPVKAEQIIRKFDQPDADPRRIAQEIGFPDHRELAEYMESKGLFWDSDIMNYSEKPALGPEPQIEDMPAPSIITTDDDITIYLPMLMLLERNRDRLLELLEPASDGNIPKYAVPGVPKTKSVYMSDQLSRLMADFSQSMNLSQRDIVEAALVEYLRKYGFQKEVDHLINKH